MMRIHTLELTVSQDWPILWKVKLKPVFFSPPLKQSTYCIGLVLETPTTGYCFGRKWFYM